MKGVILAGGSGSRLEPLTSAINKHLLPVGKKPMLFHPIEKLVNACIKDIIVVTGINHAGSIIECLGSGAYFGCHIEYAVQDEAGGIAQALALTKRFKPDDRMCVILGDNMFENSLAGYVKVYRKQNKKAMILLKEVKDPTRFGVAELFEKQLMSIEEKPVKPKSDLAVTGIYFYDSSVYNIIDTLEPSDRGELEISDVNNYYLREKELGYDILNGWWSDAGTHESLMKANTMMSILRR